MKTPLQKRFAYLDNPTWWAEQFKQVDGDEDGFGIQVLLNMIKFAFADEIRKAQEDAAYEEELSTITRNALVDTQYVLRYKLHKEQVDQMLEDRDGLCDICHKSSSNGRRLHVDHDHITGEVRGVLCNNCNTGIGFMKDSPERLRAAADYLEKYLK